DAGRARVPWRGCAGLATGMGVSAVPEEPFDPLHPFRHGRLGAVIARPVVTSIDQLVGQMLLGGDAVRFVVWVDVGLAVADLLRTRIMSVTQMGRNEADP